MTEFQYITDDEWDELLDNISREKCTPFIGAGACSGILPLAKDISNQWASEYNYPFEDNSDLARVAQFLSIRRSEIFPKQELQSLFRSINPPDFSQPYEPHSVLAGLNLPIYITTNYDNFMSQALKYHGKNDVKQDFCRWNKYTLDYDLVPKPVFKSGYKPTPSSPLVYHFHGSIEVPQSMVLSESDYLDFLIGLSNDDTKLPAPIRMALAGTSLLFVGYSLADWNFRVLFRGLINVAKSNAGYTSIAVQLPPSVPDQRKEDASKYLDQYLGKISGVEVSVYWGDAKDFVKELRKRQEERREENVNGPT
jgi:SIR2-like domain